MNDAEIKAFMDGGELIETPVAKGYNLIGKFTGVDDFLDEWEDSDGYNATCTREIITLN